MFLKKCRWHFDSVLTKVEEFGVSQGPDGWAACRAGRQRDQMERVNYWTRGEEPGCRRGSNNRTEEKDSRGEVGTAAGRGKERPGQTSMRSVANRIIAFLLLAGRLNHCSPGLKKATCRPSTTEAFLPHPPPTPRQKSSGKRGHFCTR